LRTLKRKIRKHSRVKHPVKKKKKQMKLGGKRQSGKKEKRGVGVRILTQGVEEKPPMSSARKLSSTSGNVEK